MAIQFTCPYCGHTTNVSTKYVGKAGPCVRCGRVITVPAQAGEPRPTPPPFQSAGRPIGNDPAIRMLLPVGRSPWAIAAGYAGLFALIPFFAPIALILGIIAIVDIRRHPDRHGMGRAVFGFVMGLIFSAVFLVTLIAIIAEASN